MKLRCKTLDSMARRIAPYCLLVILLVLPFASSPADAQAQEASPNSTTQPSPGESDFVSDVISGKTGPDVWTSPKGLSSTLQIMFLLTVLTLAPAIMLMTTSFIRIIVVLSLLRQALGTQQLPPNQVISSLALFMTIMIMTPVWKQVYDDSIKPYTDPSVEMSLQQAWEAGIKPVRLFMSRQLKYSGNIDDVWLFYDYLPEETPRPKTFKDVPIQVLIPAFMLSELKIAFLIGFQVYLPFLILDIVVASVTISMGMLMLPPVMISLPFKLMLFVLVDGWRLVVGQLLQSFVPYL